jgi:hypothetical protein
LNTADLKAEESPYVAFRADHVALREGILNYGRVDAKGIPLTVFADNDKLSASLPKHLEEYEDTEHHVFYKTLQGPNVSWNFFFFKFELFLLLFSCISSNGLKHQKRCLCLPS